MGSYTGPEASSGGVAAPALGWTAASYDTAGSRAGDATAGAGARASCRKNDESWIIGAGREGSEMNNSALTHPRRLGLVGDGSELLLDSLLNL